MKALTSIEEAFIFAAFCQYLFCTAVGVFATSLRMFPRIVRKVASIVSARLLSVFPRRSPRKRF